jgi:hypothetical protein
MTACAWKNSKRLKPEFNGMADKNPAAIAVGLMLI